MNKKYNLLIPMAGKGSRFLNQGFDTPKPLISVANKQSIDWSLGAINLQECNLIFIVRKEHIDNYNIDKILKQKFGEDIVIISIDGDTRGSVETCLYAKKYIDNEIPLFTYTLDVCWKPVFNPASIELEDGFLLTYWSDCPAHSYVKLGKNGNVVETAEKEVISNNATIGLYYFRTGKMFVKYAEELLDKKITHKNEFYICPIYNLLIRDGLIVKTREVEEVHVIGTPKDVEIFNKYVEKYDTNIA
jgi:NDP-sugar pyrophosphorylase family protein